MTPKKVAPAWHGWLHYQYDDPPNVTLITNKQLVQKETYVEPYFRSHRTPVFKTDYPDKSYLNPGHLQNPNKKAFK